MLKKIFLPLFFIFSYSFTYSQSNDHLEQARIDYKNGKIQAVIDNLSPHLSSVESGNKKDAYSLLILSHLYLNNQKQAGELMEDLLAFDPEYLPDEQAPPELWELFHSFRVRPFWALGLKVGANMSLPNVIKTFTLDNFETTEGKYSAGISFATALFLSKPFSEKVELFIQPSFLSANILYEGTAFNYAEITTQETQTLIQVPIAFKLNLGNRSDFTKPSKKINPFIYVGGGFNYLLSSSIKAERVDNFGDNSEFSRQVSEKSNNVSEMRNQITYMALGGIGVEYRMGKSHISLDASYQYSFNNHVRTENRYNSKSLLFDYGYLDSDLNVNRIMITVGYIYSFYKPHKLEKKKRKDNIGDKKNKKKK